MARWITLCLGVALLALPGLAIADNVLTPGGGADTWTFYGYGNGYALAQILEAIKRMTDPASNPGFRNLTMVLAIVGFLALSFTGILSGAFHKVAFYFGGMVLTIYLLFSLKVNIYVEDMVWDGAGAPQFSQQIQGVPAAIGLPAVVISEIGMWATRGIETNFTTPDYQNLRISEGAPVGMAASMLNDMRNIRLSDPYLRSSIQSFINDCALPNIFNGQISPVTLITSTNAWGVLGNNLNEAVYTAVYSTAEPRGEMYACDEAYASIDSRLQATAPALVSGMGEVSPFWLQQAAGDTTLSQAALEDSFRWASGGSVVQDATGLATQAAIAEMYSGTYEYAAMATGSSELISALNIEQARRAQQSGWYSTAILFRDMSGYFFAILQAFVIGLAPIVFAAILVPGLGRKMGVSYAQVMTWLILWWPGLAIVNYIMMLYFQGQTTGYISDGLTMANMGAVTEMSDKMVMASGFMATLVPAIMWGLVSGSGMAFTSVLDRASGAQHAATAASSISTGAATAGQVSMNNANMNAHQTSHRYTSGNEVSAHHVGVASSMVTNLSGQDMNVGLRQADFRESYSESQALSQATQRTQEAKESFSQQSQQMLSDVLRDTEQYATSQGFVTDGGVDWSRMTQDRQGQQYAREIGAIQQQMQRAGFSEQEISDATESAAAQARTEIGGEIRKGISLNIGATAYGRVGASAEYGGRLTDSSKEQSSLDSSTDQSMGNRLHIGKDGSISVTGSEGVKYSERLSEAESKDVIMARGGEDRASRLFAASQDYQEAVQAQQRAQQDYTASVSGSIPTPVNPNVASEMQKGNQRIRENVGQQMNRDQGQIDQAGGSITSAVGGQLGSVQSRTEGVSNRQADLRESGIPALTTDVGGGIQEHREGAREGVENPDVFRVMDDGNQLSVYDRRQVQEAEDRNLRAIINGGERTNIEIGDTKMVHAFYMANEDGTSTSVYAVEREGGHSYYSYTGDGQFEAVEVRQPLTLDQYQQQSDNGMVMNPTRGTFDRAEISRQAVEPAVTLDNIKEGLGSLPEKVGFGREDNPNSPSQAVDADPRENMPTR